MRPRLGRSNDRTTETGSQSPVRSYSAALYGREGITRQQRQQHVPPSCSVSKQTTNFRRISDTNLSLPVCYTTTTRSPADVGRSKGMRRCGQRVDDANDFPAPLPVLITASEWKHGKVVYKVAPSYSKVVKSLVVFPLVLLSAAAHSSPSLRPAARGTLPPCPPCSPPDTSPTSSPCSGRTTR